MAISSSTDSAIEAAAFCSHGCFHRSIWLLATTLHQKLRVTFATTRNFDTENASLLPTALFCLPMGASRLLIYHLDHAAHKAGVKLIIIDRPGFGGSTPVPLEQRVDVYIESVPAVLKKLDVSHVALMSHSAGSIYLHNILLRLPDILHPKHPYVAVLAPWVHPKHSTAPLSALVETLPQSWIGNYHHIQNFVGSTIAPSLQFSSGLISAAKPTYAETENSSCLLLYGTNRDVWQEVNRLQSLYFRSEDSSGVSEDALLCMKKSGSFWGVYNAELPDYLNTLHQSLTASGRTLDYRAFFAESDVLVGKGGQEYFEQCWKSSPLRLHSTLVPKTNHDTIVLPEKGCVVQVLEEIAAVLREMI